MLGVPDPLLTPSAPPSPIVPVPDPVLTVEPATAFALVPDWSVLEWIGHSALVLVALVLTALVAHGLPAIARAATEASSRGSSAGARRGDAHRFTLLVPARFAAQTLGRTLDRLAEQSHPHVTVLAIVGPDDPETERAAREAVTRHPGRVDVVVTKTPPASRAVALNAGLARADGDVVGTFGDADDVDPDLLGIVDARLDWTAADVVQTAVELETDRSDGAGLHHALEPDLRRGAGAGAPPFGLPGESGVFVRREWLVWSGGWDRESLAESCALGVLLAGAGARVVTAAAREAVRSGGPTTLGGFARQQLRWNRGVMQVVVAGAWRTLPRRPRRAALTLLVRPFVQAATTALVPIVIALAVLTRVPTPVLLLTLAPLVPAALTVAARLGWLAARERERGRRLRPADVGRLVLGAVPFALVRVGAAAGALARRGAGSSRWEQTGPTGPTAPTAAPLAPRELVQLAAAARGRVTGGGAVTNRTVTNRTVTNRTVTNRAVTNRAAVANRPAIANRAAVTVRPAARNQRPMSVALAASARLRRDLAWLLLAVSLAAVVVLPNLGGSPVSSPVEARYTQQVWSFVDGSVTPESAPGVGVRQLAAYAQLTNAFSRHDGSVVAAREATAIATLASVVLVWLLARRLSLSRPAATAAAALVAIAPIAVELHRHAALDTLATAWALAAILLLASRRRWAYAAVGATAALALAVLTAATGRAPADGLGSLLATAALPCAALLVAGGTDRALRFLRGQGRRRRVTGIAWLAGVAAATVAIAPAWGVQLRALVVDDPAAPLRQAQAWVETNVQRSATLVVDDAIGVDLIRAGFDRDGVVGWSAADGPAAPETWADVDYVVTSAATRSAPRGDPANATALASSVVVAQFGSGTRRSEVRRVDPDGMARASARAAAASASRAAAGTALARNPRLELSGEARRQLTAGLVDSRIIVALAQWLADRDVSVGAFPSVAGEGGAQALRRQVLITRVGDQSADGGAGRAVALEWLGELSGVLSTRSVEATGAGVLATFSFNEPVGLLPDSP